MRVDLIYISVAFDSSLSTIVLCIWTTRSESLVWVQHTYNLFLVPLVFIRLLLYCLGLHGIYGGWVRWNTCRGHHLLESWSQLFHCLWVKQANISLITVFILNWFDSNWCWSNRRNYFSLSLRVLKHLIRYLYLLHWAIRDILIFRGSWGALGAFTLWSRVWVWLIIIFITAWALIRVVIFIARLLFLKAE